MTCLSGDVLNLSASVNQKERFRSISAGQPVILSRMLDPRRFHRSGVRVRKTLPTILALVAGLAARAIHAQATPPGDTPQPIRIGSSDEGKASVKEKQRILLLLDRTRALARWMPNETSFLAVLDRVQERLVAAKEVELAPLLPFDPYLASLTATLARMEARVSGLESAVELCDPARKKDLFLLFLDALEVDGQGQVQAKICEKISAEAEAEDSVSQACVATSLGLLAARSMHDHVVVCEPSLALASSDTSGERFERLSLELAGVKAGMQESVRSSKLELTQVMSVVAGHIAETSSVQTKELGDLTVRLEIERALQQGTPYGSIYLPEAHGGRLEVVRAIVSETIQHVVESGESSNYASTKLAAGDDQLKEGHFKQAFRLYSEAYKAAMALPPKPR
jgi:hypothetical protein